MLVTDAFAAPGHMAIQSPAQRASVGAAHTRTIRLRVAPCMHRPEIGVVYPDDVWYQGVQADDVEEIVESHLKGGRPVERLILAPTEFD